MTNARTHGPDHLTAPDHLPGVGPLPALTTDHLDALQARGQAVPVTVPARDVVRPGDLIVWTCGHLAGTDPVVTAALVTRAYVRAIDVERPGYRGSGRAQVNLSSVQAYRLDPAPCLTSEAWSPGHGHGLPVRRPWRR